MTGGPNCCMGSLHRRTATAEAVPSVPSRHPMSSFSSFLQLGLQHIFSLAAADHLLFLAALILAHDPGKWRPLLILITAFTVGHSMALALATLNLVTPGTQVVEVLIPGTIIVTSLLNLWSWRQPRRANDPPRTAPARLWPRYTLAMGFGLLHGLGFSTVLRGMLGADESLLLPLLAFNIGIELAQIVVLALLAVVGALLTWIAFDRRGYVLAASGITFGCACQMILSRL